MTFSKKTIAPAAEGENLVREKGNTRKKKKKKQFSKAKDA